MKRKSILIELTGRLLTDAEADQVRAEVAAMRPKVHLIKPNWRWLECRGLAETKVAQLIETLKGMGLRFRAI